MASGISFLGHVQFLVLAEAGRAKYKLIEINKNDIVTGKIL